MCHGGGRNKISRKVAKNTHEIVKSLIRREHASPTSVNSIFIHCTGPAYIE